MWGLPPLLGPYLAATPAWGTTPPAAKVKDQDASATCDSSARALPLECRAKARFLTPFSWLQAPWCAHPGAAKPQLHDRVCSAITAPQEVLVAAIAI